MAIPRAATAAIVAAPAARFIGNGSEARDFATAATPSAAALTPELITELPVAVLSTAVSVALAAVNKPV